MPSMTAKKPIDASAPVLTSQRNLPRETPPLIQPANNETNQASPINETGHDRSGIVPHGPFVTASQPLPTPQPGASLYNPNFVPASKNAETNAAIMRKPPI